MDEKLIIVLIYCCFGSFNLNQNSYRNLISGTDRRLVCCLLRALLDGVSVFYKTSIAIRNFFYNTGLYRSYPAGNPVISIGNITTGGTGKTPLVVWLCRYLTAKDIKPAILTRGYKGVEGKVADEPAMLAKSCPGTGVIVNPDRVAGAQKAINDHHAQVLVMDDGFQHRRLRRDLDILAIDATCPFGFEKMLPAGLLREPAASIKRAHAVIITRYDQADPAAMDLLVSKIREIAPDIAIAKAVHKLTSAKICKDTEIPLEELKGKKIFAFCGVGNPNAFLANLKKLGIEVVGSRIFNDHHDYTFADTEKIHYQAVSAGAEMVLTTEKDWVKVALFIQEAREAFSDIVFAHLGLELDFIEGLGTITDLVEKTIINKND